MKTTVELPDALLRHVKLLAAQRGTTMRELMIEGLKRVVAPQIQEGGENFLLAEDETAVAEIGDYGLPVLKRRKGDEGISVSNEFVNRMRDDLSI